MESYRTSTVFIPGGMPRITYVSRAARGLEDRLRAVSDNLCKLATVTGATKSGKTVLVNTVFPRGKAVWVDGGSVREEDDLWTYVLDELGGVTERSQGTVASTTTTITGETESGMSVPLLANAQAKVGAEYARGSGTSESSVLSLAPRPAAISQLRAHGIPLVIDDFHYLDREFQGNVIRALKPLIFEGLPVVLIAIPHRRYDAVKVEKEMTGRLESIDIPSWEESELLEIPSCGFPCLNVEVPSEVCSRLAQNAYGSPHLMQQFCKDLALSNGISETAFPPTLVDSLEDSLFRAVAEGTGKVIFDKLARGPRQRSDRLQRELRIGETADIYKVVLLALAKLGPGLDTIEYEQLRGAIRDVLYGTLPQAHEVTRVLEKMAEIAMGDEASTPVLDWERDEQKLHITDPFFAFYLKWGVGAPL